MGSECVRIYLCGSLDIERHSGTGTWSQVAGWSGARKTTRSVLRRLLTMPGRRALRGQLQEDLWPDLDQALADQYLDIAMSQIRAAIGRDLVKKSDAGYELAGQAQIWLDLDASADLFRAIENQGHTMPNTIVLLEEAISLLLRGAPLEGEEGAWRYGVSKYAEDNLRQARLWLAEGYEAAGKLWQAGEQYRALCQAIPLDSDALVVWMTMLDQHGRAQDALKHYRDFKEVCEARGEGLSPKVEQCAQHLQEGSFSMAPLLSRRRALALLPGAGVALSSLLFPDEALSLYATGIMALWELFFTGSAEQVRVILPLYLSQITAIAGQSSLLQQDGAATAARAWLLARELASDCENFGQATEAGQRALFYGEQAHDVNVQVAALIGQGNTGFHRKQSAAALAAYQRSLPLLDEASPLLAGRVHAGLAEVHGMRGEEYEALSAMSEAHERYPAHPESDPGYPYTRATHYSLYVFGDAQTYLFLNRPTEASAALAYVEQHIIDPNVEPISRVDLGYYQAQAALAQGELADGCARLSSAAQLARQIGSHLYFTKLEEIYSQAQAKWPQETQLASLREVFAPW